MARSKTCTKGVRSCHCLFSEKTISVLFLNVIERVFTVLEERALEESAAGAIPHSGSDEIDSTSDGGTADAA